MTVLLTGATGFVGRQILRALFAQNINVSVVIRNPSRLTQEERIKVRRIFGMEDIFCESNDQWRDVFSNISTVIHAAWYAVPGKYLNAVENLNCLAGTVRMAEAAHMYGVKRFVGLGTCLEYSLKGGSCLDIDTELDPSTLYAAAKAGSYLALREYCKQVGMEFAWCRLFYLYGLNENDGRLAPYLHAQLSKGLEAEIRSGAAIRDFMDVVDAGREISEIAVGSYVGAANICSGIPISVKAFAENIADQYSARHLLRYRELPNDVQGHDFIVGVKTKHR